MDLPCETISSCPDRALVILQTSVIYVSKEDSCVGGNALKATTVDKLSLNQENADNKVILHSAHTIKRTEVSIILQSLSGETDIMIIPISHIDTSKRVLVGYGNGKNS